MDKGRDVRRAQSRFSPAKRQIKQSVHKLLSGLDGCEGRGGDAVFPEKPKKERVKKLSVVGRANSVNEDVEMGCSGTYGSEEEEEQQLRSQAPSPGSSKRFKLPKKFFDDCNGVDHSSVPRKLRSAMKKRSRESVSPPLPEPKKLNNGINGVDTPPKGGVKKSKLNLKHGGSDWSQKQPISGPITKEEEEAVESLYALAGMFPDNDKTDNKGELVGESSESKPLTLPEEGESPAPALVSEEDSKCLTGAGEAANPLSNSLGETVEKVKSLKEPTVQEQGNIPTGEQEHTGSDGSVPQVNIRTIPSLSKGEVADEKLVLRSVKFDVPYEQSLDTGLMKLKQQEAPIPETKPEIEQQHTIKDSRKNDLVLWPGLSSTGSIGTAIHGLPLHSSAKTQAWLDNATGTTGPSSFGNGVSTEKVSRVMVHKKQPWKRCAAHVRISRLIQDLQNSERKERLSMQPNQLRTDEGSKQVGSLAGNNPSGLRNGLNGVVSANSIGGSAVENNSTEARKDILLQQGLHQDQQQAPASGTYTSQKQSYDFLSLSAGGGGVEANNSSNRAVNDPEPSSQLHVPYLHPLPQHHTLIPFSLHQTRYSASPYPDQLSAAAAAVAQQRKDLIIDNGPAAAISISQQQFMWIPSYGPFRLKTTAATTAAAAATSTATKDVGSAGNSIQTGGYFCIPYSKLAKWKT
ncbi:unnamed protein product, partial [Vitis vinifera]